ncbi:unnamed protein product, partial [Nesidiocoris tenuis]
MVYEADALTATVHTSTPGACSSSTVAMYSGLSKFSSPAPLNVRRTRPMSGD